MDQYPLTAIEDKRVRICWRKANRGFVFDRYDYILRIPVPARPTRHDIGIPQHIRWQTEGGIVTEDSLRALNIPYQRLDDHHRVEHRIREAATLAESSLRPVALLLCRDLMWEA